MLLRYDCDTNHTRYNNNFFSFFFRPLVVCVGGIEYLLCMLSKSPATLDRPVFFPRRPNSKLLEVDEAPPVGANFDFQRITDGYALP